MSRANWLIFALEPKLELYTETLILHSGSKFLCFVVHFYKYFWFCYQTGFVSKKVYAVIWSVLEITSLKPSLVSRQLKNQTNIKWKVKDSSDFIINFTLSIYIQVHGAEIASRIISVSCVLLVVQHITYT